MPPKRPQIAPSQTTFSVQDVRDYSTPEGAAMANEEFRRLRQALEDLAKKVDPDVRAGKPPVAPVTGTPTAPGGTPGGGTPPAEPSALEVWNYFNAGGADNGVQNVTRIDFDDNGQTTRDIPVNFEATQMASGRVRIRAYVPNQSVLANPDLQIQENGRNIGPADTRIINFAGNYNCDYDSYSEEVVWSISNNAPGTPGKRTVRAFVKDQSLSVFDHEDYINLNGLPRAGFLRTTAIRFDSQGKLYGERPIRFELVETDEADRCGRTVWLRAYVGTDSPDEDLYVWNLEVDGYGSTPIENTQTVTFTTDSVFLQRNGRTVHIDYWFRLRTNNDTLNDYIVEHDNVVNLIQGPGITITQNGGDVTFRSNGGGDGGGGTPSGTRRIKVGVVELTNVTPKTAGYHGDECYGDIVHNWSLADMHAYTLTMLDCIYDPTVTPQSQWMHRGNPYAFDYRDALGANVREGQLDASSLPEIVTVDNDTIRIYATIPKLAGATAGNAPTTLKYYYKLDELI